MLSNILKLISSQQRTLCESTSYGLIQWSFIPWVPDAQLALFLLLYLLPNIHLLLCIACGMLSFYRKKERIYWSRQAIVSGGICLGLCVAMYWQGWSPTNDFHPSLALLPMASMAVLFGIIGLLTNDQTPRT